MAFGSPKHSSSAWASAPRWAVLIVLLALQACSGGGSSEPAVDAQSADGIRRTAQSTAVSSATAAEATTIRLFQAFWGRAPSVAEFSALLLRVESDGPSTAAASLAASPSLAGLSDADLAQRVLDNLYITPATVPQADSYEILRTALAQIYAGYGRDARGQITLNASNLLSQLQGDVTWGAAATRFTDKTAANYGIVALAMAEAGAGASAITAAALMNWMFTAGAGLLLASP